MPGANGQITVLAPTGFEYAAHRLLLPGARVMHAGIRLSRGMAGAETVIVSGLAGGLASGCCPGTVVIPREVRSEGGAPRQCDPELVAALSEAARGLGFDPCHSPLLTARTLVTGQQRRFWAAQGFVACDMETALIPAGIARFATIRVVLDTSEHSISEGWLSGPRAALDRRLWGELIWLAAHAPRFALRAASITRAALSRIDIEASDHAQAGQ